MCVCRERERERERERREGMGRRATAALNSYKFLIRQAVSDTKSMRFHR